VITGHTSHGFRHITTLLRGLRDLLERMA